jgi:hypothetical protein
MPFATPWCSNPARVQFHCNGFWRNCPRQLNLPNERSQCLGPNERRPAARGASSGLAGRRFDHSQSRQHANDSGVVPAAVALRRHAPPVQFVGYCAAGNDTARSQFANRRCEGRRNRSPLFHERFSWPSCRAHCATVVGLGDSGSYFCVFSFQPRVKSSIVGGTLKTNFLSRPELSSHLSSPRDRAPRTGAETPSIDQSLFRGSNLIAVCVCVAFRGTIAAEEGSGPGGQ